MRWSRRNLVERGTSPLTEVLGGITTFLAMAYILFVNPQVLGACGMDARALITVTALATVFGTLAAALWADVPYAMAPGMGLNAFFAYGLVIGRKVAWQTALGVVFFSGVLFLILTLCGVRRRVLGAIPESLRLAIAAGIGVFIAFIGLTNLAAIVDHPVTLVQLGPASRPLLLGLFGLLMCAWLEVRKVPGALLIGILTTTGLGILTGDVTPPSAIFSLPPSPAPVVLALDLGAALRWGLAGAVFSFMFVDLFDSVGSILACAYEAGMVREDGSVDKLDRVLEADAAATVVGAALGTSTTTTYIESGAGIVQGARTGLASVITAGCFLLALFFTPVIGAVPAFATAPALILIGVHMFRHVGRIEFRQLEEGVPAFLTIIMMPLTYSISTGLAVGFLSWVLLRSAAGRAREVRPFMWVIAGLSLACLALEMTRA